MEAAVEARHLPSKNNMSTSDDMFFGIAAMVRQQADRRIKMVRRLVRRPLKETGRKSQHVLSLA